VTTTFFLVRHATHDRVGTVLCGRMPGIRLGEPGQRQALRLAERLASETIATVQTSPLERARETAEPIAERIGRSAELCEAISEIDFGSWTGSRFEDLSGDPRWQAWNAARSVSRPPEGETMLETQVRVIGAMERLRSLHRDKGVVLVSHGDVIKTALLYHLGLSIEAYSRFDIDPASVSTLAVGEWGSKVIRINEVVAA
jgi:broad specificity phosphatase PhoE